MAIQEHNHKKIGDKNIEMESESNIEKNKKNKKAEIKYFKD